MSGKSQRNGPRLSPPTKRATPNPPSPTSLDPDTSKPLVSIIVPTLNRGPFLERCLLSILRQSYPNIECLVMDGASKDNSISILERLAREDSRLRFVSEPDRGEVEAANKGMDLARGDIVGIQASDDYYVTDAVETAVDFLRQNQNHIGVAGDAWFVDPQGNPLGRGMITCRGPMTRQSLRRLLIFRYKMSFLNHGTFFGWRVRLLRHGRLDPEYSVTPDLDFYSRLLAAGEEIGCLPRIQAHYTIHPEMGAVQHWQKVDGQLRRIHDRYGLRWHHHLLRVTVGRLISYLANPLRTPLLPGLVRETKEWRRRRSSTRRSG